jgi:hypothetical protein
MNDLTHLDWRRSPPAASFDLKIAVQLAGKALSAIRGAEGWLVLCENRLNDSRPVDAAAASVIRRAADYVENDLEEIMTAVQRLRRCLGETPCS